MPPYIEQPDPLPGRLAREEPLRADETLELYPQFSDYPDQ